MSELKLWPVNQLLDWLEKCESKFITIKSNDISVLLAILKFANNETLECFPSIDKISRITLKGKTRIRDVIKRLIKIGILTSKERYSKEGDRDSNLYKYNPDKLWGVGAICSLPWATNVTYGRLQMYPLTTKLNTQVTKKPFIKKYRCGTNRPISNSSNITNKQKSFSLNNKKEKNNNLYPSANKASAILEEFILKRK